MHAQDTHKKRTANQQYSDSFLEGAKANMRSNRAASLYLGSRTVAKDKHGNERVINERVIQLIAKRNGPDFANSFHNGGEGFLNQLALYPDQCIPKLTIASHGWGESRPEGGDGIPIYSGAPADPGALDSPATGFYRDEFTRKAEVERAVQRYRDVYPDADEDEVRQMRKQYKYDLNSHKYARTLGDLQEIMSTGRIKVVNDQGKAMLIPAAFADGKNKVTFCNECLIQLYGCNTSEKFANALAYTSGCQVVYGTGNVAPVDFTGNKLGLDPTTGAYNHVWIGDRKANNERNGAIYRITPIKDRGRVKSTLKEQLTTPGKSAWDSVEMRVVPFSEIRKN